MKNIIHLIIIIFTLFIFHCSPPAGPGNAIGNITELNSYILQSTAHNRLEWYLINNTEYNIYRYQLQSDAAPDLTILNHTINEYEDTTAAVDTPYFYKVASVINGEECNTPYLPCTESRP